MAEARIGEPLVNVEEVVSILNRISIFGGLDDKQLYDVFGVLRKVSYHKGEFIFEENDPPSDIYVVESGSVEIILDAEGERLAAAVFGVGECFGEVSVIGIQNHTAGAVARQDTELIILPREALFKFWDTDKALFGMLVLNIAREACRRLHKADETLLHYFAHKNHKD